MEQISQFLWNFLLIPLSAIGLYLMVRLKFLPLRKLPFSICAVFRPTPDSTEGDITPFQSLMTSLAAMIGTGNITGVASAIILGGPGALFWMEVSALLGLSTKYAESFLSVLFRTKNANGEICGGPMYVMKAAIQPASLGSWLALFYSSATIISSFGIGNMTQANALATAGQSHFQIPCWVSGVILTILTSCILVGGIKRIGKICGFFIPLMSIFYILSAFCVIIIHISALPKTILLIFRSAFSPKSFFGGIAGHTLSQTIRWGMARGIFSNEAGLGSGGIAAACAKTDNPIHQAYISMSGNFFDTLFMCTLTGLAILCSGVLTLDSQGTTQLTIQAFQSTFSFGGLIVAVAQILFAFSTIIGWEYYGEKSLEFLSPSPYAITTYRILYSLAAFFGCILPLHTIWSFADIANALMVIPNLICLYLLRDTIISTRSIS
ncbi:MAG: alanine/glycine:cation symporter family protein [Lachnospiraceae bacterium]